MKISMDLMLSLLAYSVVLYLESSYVGWPLTLQWLRSHVSIDSRGPPGSKSWHTFHITCGVNNTKPFYAECLVVGGFWWGNHILGEESSISVHWFRFLTDVLCFKCSATVHVGVCINNCRILPSNVVMAVYCMFSQCGHARVTVCQCPSVFFNPEL